MRMKTPAPVDSFFLLVASKCFAMQLLLSQHIVWHGYLSALTLGAPIAPPSICILASNKLFFAQQSLAVFRALGNVAKGKTRLSFANFSGTSQKLQCRQNWGTATMYTAETLGVNVAIQQSRLNSKLISRK